MGWARLGSNQRPPACESSARLASIYELGRMLPFWQLTSEQDWALCERNQRGILSTAYRPGPYSPSRESNVIAFVDWYLTMLAGPSNAALDARGE
jgi:phenylpropionate dioxygenase-like ring-hydroxylating dioxygenase large terminal subunit